MAHSRGPACLVEVDGSRAAPTSDEAVERFAAAAGDRAIADWFAERVDRDPDGIAFRYKDAGIWHAVSWRAFADQVEAVAAGLTTLGVGEGDVVALMAGRMPEWFVIDLAIQTIGAITCGIQPTTGVEDLSHIVRDAAPRVFIAEDQEYVDKFLDIPGNKDLADHLIVVDEKGLFGYGDPRISSYTALEQAGADHLRERPGLLASEGTRRSSDAPVGLFYTSGTTGRPKGVVLTSRNLIQPNIAIAEILGRLGKDDRTFNFLPSATHMERVYCYILPIIYGAVAHIPESDEAASEGLVEVQPTVIMGSPRILESLASRVAIDMESAGRVRRALYGLAVKVRERYLDAIWQGQQPSAFSRVTAAAMKALMTQPILRKLGLGAVRYTVIGGAAISPAMKLQWQVWGLRPTEGYGLTETGGSVTMQRAQHPKPGDAGPPIPGTEVKLAEDGELLFRGPGCFSGYWKNPVATAEMIDQDGWVHSGDIGTFNDDGSIRVIDRRKAMVTLADGTVVPSATVELALKLSPYITDAAVMPLDEDRSLGVLIEMDFDNVANWAKKRRLAFTSYGSLAAHPETVALMAAAVEDANAYLLAEGHPLVRGFRVLPKELDPEEGDEITVTRKVRREALARKFHDLVTELEDDVRRNGPTTSAIASDRS